MRQLLTSFIGGTLSLEGLWIWIKARMAAGGSDFILSLASKVLSHNVGICILIAIGLLEMFYGKKFINVQKFIAFGMAGYVAGVVIIAPWINKLFPLSTFICGVSFAVLCAVISKFLYNLALYGGSGALCYLLFVSNGIFPFSLPTEGDRILSAAVALVIVIVLFLFRKNIDRLATSFVGACFVAVAFKRVYNYTALLPGKERFLLLIVVIILTVGGFIYQYKRRKKYYG